MDKRRSDRIRKIKQKKPLGDEGPKVIVGVEKQEKRPNGDRRLAGEARVMPHLSPLDMIEPSNLGISDRVVSKDIFKSVETVPQNALVPEARQLDEMSMGELFSGMFGKVKSNLSNMIKSKVEDIKGKVRAKYGDVKSSIQHQVYKYKDMGYQRLGQALTKGAERVIGMGYDGMAHSKDSICSYCVERCHETPDFRDTLGQFGYNLVKK